MYPRGELDELAQRKRILQARIAVRRWECAEAAVVLSQPLAMVDRGMEVWRRISPFLKILAVPAGLLLARFLKRRKTGSAHQHHSGAAVKTGKFAALLAALPWIIRGVKMVMAMRARAKHARAPVEPEPQPAPSRQDNEARAAGL